MDRLPPSASAPSVASSVTSEGECHSSRDERKNTPALTNERKRYSAFATSFSSSSCCNSPAWYISIMMSLPPTNSPLT